MTHSLATALHQARRELAPVVGELAALEARLLAQHAWGMSEEVLVKDATQELDDIQIGKLKALVARRLRREPIAHIVGYKHFWKAAFKVSSGVLTPRADSETLIETVLKHRPEKDRPYRILDLGTGSGCLLLSLLGEYRNARGVGIDISPEALRIAMKNADALGMGARANFALSRWCEALSTDDAFDIVVANPPYIPHRDIGTLDADVKDHEPHLALDGGNDGLDCYRAILSELGAHLASGAFVACETGIGQARMVCTIAEHERYNVSDVVKDLAGTERVVALMKKSNV